MGRAQQPVAQAARSDDGAMRLGRTGYGEHTSSTVTCAVSSGMTVKKSSKSELLVATWTTWPSSSRAQRTASLRCSASQALRRALGAPAYPISGLALP